MAQKDQAHDGHEVLVAGVVRVRTQVVRRAPQTLLYCFDVFELGHGSSLVFCESYFELLQQALRGADAVVLHSEFY